MAINPRDTVRVRGANVPMNTQEPPPPPNPPWGGESQVPYDWARERYGTPAAPTPPGQRGITWQELFPDSPLNPPVPFPEFPETDRRASSAIRGTSLAERARPSFVPEIAEEPAAMTFADFIASMGGFDSSPYDNYMNFLLQQDEETMARINAMYAQLAESAGANMQRVADVYDSARIQSGDVFGGSAQNIEDAYSSASQQAADQMARLGIEAAAPAVLNPMALSQAEAVSGIERAGAGALDALTRYGASAQDFGGQMAQVGQQQGLEVSNRILRDMQQRQAEAAFQREQARANYNPYAQAMQQMQAEQMWNEPMVRAQEQERQRAFEMAKQQVQLMAQYDNDIMRDVRELMSQGYDYNGAIEIITNTRMFNPYQQ
jgi:hypothetical protein